MQECTATAATRRFHPTFWVANVLELFERFSFYGTKAILAVYLAKTLGFGLATGGLLVGLYSGLMYTLPPVAGVLVDRYGYRRALAACFFIFALGYTGIGLAGMEVAQGVVQSIGLVPYVTVVLLVTAVGGSLIKPCLTGTIMRTTSEESRTMGFSIYYCLVNIGGGLGPILALSVRESIGISYVMIMAGMTSAAMFVSTLLFFREPPVPAGADLAPRSFGRVYMEMLTVLSNVRFMLFLLIFSGFYIMFWQIFYSFPFYVTDVLKYERFELLETVDAWVIIIAAIPLGWLVKRWDPIVAMSIGLLIASGAWLIMAASPTIIAAILATGLFAIGEAMQAPRYYQYAGSLAPKHQVATYMGYAFLPVAIGSYVGGPLGGWLVQTYLVDSYQPTTMWLIISGIGFTSTAMLVIYNAVLGRGDREATLKPATAS